MTDKEPDFDDIQVDPIDDYDPLREAIRPPKKPEISGPRIVEEGFSVSIELLLVIVSILCGVIVGLTIGGMLWR